MFGVMDANSKEFQFHEVFQFHGEFQIGEVFEFYGEFQIGIQMIL